MKRFGKTGEGRALVAVIVSGDGVFSPAALHRGKRPVVFIQNAIHAGEMDGKDASLAFLRDISGYQKAGVDCLSARCWLFVPSLQRRWP